MSIDRCIKAGDFIQVRRIEKGRLFAIFCPLGAIQIDDCEMYIRRGVGTAVFAAIDLLSILDPTLALEQATFIDDEWEVFTVKELK